MCDTEMLNEFTDASNYTRYQRLSDNSF